MIALTLAEIAEIVGGDLVLPDGAAASDVVAGSVETDSRKVSAGSIFFAMPGAATDGHLFAPTAVEGGAALVIDERVLELPVPQIVVPDGAEALAALARAVVQRVRDRGSLRVVGVTGSNGKTTTKNMLAAVLATQGPTVAPAGSFNNHVGAPMTMLRIDEDTRFLVVEMGAGGPGQIERLIRIVVPDVGVVLKIGLAHAGMFGSIDEIQRTKAAMVTDLPPEALAVLNIDDPRVMAMAGMTRGRIATFGLGRDADVRAEDVRVDAAGTSFTVTAGGAAHPVRLRILGEHQAMNVLATLAVARELGVPLPDAIAALEAMTRAERWRMELLERADGVTVINDAYNASPDSMAAALKTLAELTRGERRSVAVLGEMAELGEFATEEHDRIGRLVVRLNIAQLVVVGERARAIHQAAALEGSWDGESRFVADPDAAYDAVRELLRPGDVVLVKSSNSAMLRFLGDRLAEVTA